MFHTEGTANEMPWDMKYYRAFKELKDGQCGQKVRRKLAQNETREEMGGTIQGLRCSGFILRAMENLHIMMIWTIILYIRKFILRGEVSILLTVLQLLCGRAKIQVYMILWALFSDYVTELRMGFLNKVN